MFQYPLKNRVLRNREMALHMLLLSIQKEKLIYETSLKLKSYCKQNLRCITRFAFQSSSLTFKVLKAKHNKHTKGGTLVQLFTRGSLAKLMMMFLRTGVRNAGMLLFLLCPSDKTVCKHSTISAIISHAAITCFVSLLGEKEIQFYESTRKTVILKDINTKNS